MQVLADKREQKLVTIGFNAGPAWHRLLSELAFQSRTLNRSKIMRDAIIEKADRDLPTNWRDMVQFDEEAVAS